MNMNNGLVIAFALMVIFGLGLDQAHGQGFQMGGCAKPQLLNSFNISAFPLNWYLIGDLPLPNDNNNIKCGQLNITPTANPSVLQFNYSEFNKITNMTEAISFMGYMVPNIPNSFTYMESVNIPYVNMNVNITKQLDIISTDSLTYSVVRECADIFGFARMESYSLFSTSTTLPDDVLAFLKTQAMLNGIDVSSYVAYDNKNC